MRVVDDFSEAIGSVSGITERRSPPGSPARAGGGRRRIDGAIRLGGAFLLLAAIAALTFMPIIRHGGRFADDWSLAALHHFGHSFVGFDPGRPLSAPYRSMLYALGGSDPRVHIAIGVGVAALMCAALVYALRAAGLARVDSMAVAVLFLLFEPSDAARMWVSASHAQLAVAFYFIGLAACLKAFDQEGPRAWALHGISLAFYLASVLLYQTATTAILASVALYAVKASPRRALGRWPADLAVVAVGAISQAGTPDYAGSHGLELITHAAKMVAGTMLLATWAIFPIGSYHAPTPARVVGGLVLVGLAVAVVTALKGRRPTGMALWSSLAVSGLAFALVSYGVYIPASGYTPVAQGIGNRTNVLAAAGFALFVWSCCRLVGTMSPGRLGRYGAPILAALLAIGYIHADRRDQRDWITATREQQMVLRQLRRLGRPGRHAHVFVWGPRAFAFTGVPVFFAPYDLEPAFQLLWNDESLRAVPITRYTLARCDIDHVTPRGLDPFDPPTAEYGPRTVFVDLRTGRSTRVTTRERCLDWNRRVKPAPSPGL
jgi:hypothetical protein